MKSVPNDGLTDSCKMLLRDFNHFNKELFKKTALNANILISILF